MRSLSDFRTRYVEPLLNGLSYPFPVSCDEEDGVLITKIYPDFNCFGKLGLHPEGAIYADGTDPTNVSALLVLYVRNRVCSIGRGRCVVGGSFDQEQQIWSNWTLTVDDFDEYAEPQKATAFPEQSFATEAVSEMSRLLSASFGCAFEPLEDGSSWSAQLMPAIRLEAVASRGSRDSKQLRIELSLRGEKVLFGSGKYARLNYEITDSNELSFIGFD